MSTWESFIQSFQAVPPPAWAVISSVISACIAGGIAFIGVWTTNRANSARLHVQLENDRNLKREDREHAMRKEVFLATAEVMAMGCQAVSNIGNLALSPEKAVQTYLDKSHAIARAMLIARTETARQLLEFRSEMAFAILEVGGRRPGSIVGCKPEDIEAEISGLRARFHETEIERERAIGARDEPGLQVCERLLLWLRQDIEIREGELDSVRKQRAKQQFHLSEYSLGRVNKLEKLAMEVCAKMRIELGLAENLQESLVMIQEAGDKVLEYLSLAIAKVSR